MGGLFEAVDDGDPTAEHGVEVHPRVPLDAGGIAHEHDRDHRTPLDEVALWSLHVAQQALDDVQSKGGDVDLARTGRA